MIKVLVYSLFFALLTACNHNENKQPELSNADISKVTLKMTDIMIHDVTNPPLAARFFSYACLAGYEVVAQNDSTMQDMHGVLNDYPNIKKPDGLENYSYQLSAVFAMLETAKKMQPSGSLFEQYGQQFIDSCKKAGFSEEVIENSRQYALQICKQILAYAKADRYNRISNYPRYTPLNGDGYWYPTPPGFFAPVEPYFNTIRPFTLDTCSQFKPVPPTAFSKHKDSEFYKLTLAVYEAGSSDQTKEKRTIAAFWDCNPFALDDNGHLSVGLKKISPGAHWLGITAIACKKANTGFSKAMKINTMVAIGLMDSFICCWDEKFRSNRIRPETAIRKYIDPNWKPLLQTPPFPEYLSGHSTISTTSALILTYYFGDNFAYTDDVEVRYGLPKRRFKSFGDAAAEAAISRFYGGIHFMDAIDNGVSQGLKTGNWVLKKVEGKARIKTWLIKKN